MSEAAPEAPPARPPARGGGNVFTRKIGPLPMWAWVAIISALLIGYAYYKNKKSGQQSSTTTPTGTDASQVPQFVNQTYTTVVPPTATQPSPAPAPTPAPGPKPKNVVVSEPVFNGKYKVRKGDTLESVASRYGITREQLAHANGFGTGAGLRTGQQIRVPSPPPKGRPNPAP